MNRKNHLGLLAVGVVSLLLIGSIGCLHCDNSDDKVEHIQHNPIEKIPLYYNLDNPDIIYTRNKAGDFEEITING